MFKKSVCLLLRATCCKPLEVKGHEHNYDDLEDYMCEEDNEDEDGDDDLNEVYFSGSSLRIGNCG